MRNISFSAKKVIYGVCVILALCQFGVNAATLPPDPDNAALLYYQAFLLLPDPNMNLIYPVLDGAEPDEKVREYLNLSDCRETIEFAEVAAQLPYCNWGIRFSQGFGACLPQLEYFRPLRFLLYADARVLAKDGDYQAAFNRCLTIRRIAWHVGDDTMLNYVVSVDTDGSALRYIQDILGSMSPDTEILTWLRGRLASVQGAVLSPAKVLEMNLELILQSMRNDPDDLLWLREQLAEDDEGNDPEFFWNLTDEELLTIIAEPYADFLDNALGVIDSEMSYEEKYTELQKLIDELKEEFGDVSGTKELILSFGPEVTQIYSIQIGYTARLNALKAAIEIYLATANTGQLPDTIPDYLPKDPFSGQDFEYEITENGFVLRCRAKDIYTTLRRFWPPGTPPEVLAKGIVYEYEFKVQSNMENN